jgi:cyanosortase A-associated protein
MNDLSIASRNYRYSRNGQQLDIEMRYFVEGTYGDVSQILRDSNLQRRKPDMSAQTSDQGSYVLFTESGASYLSACIAPTHRTTASEADFRGEQNRPQVLASRLFPWLLGIAPLRDLRCVWTKMSIRPLTSSSATTPKGALTQPQELEQAWQQWAQWWKQNYPPEGS